MKRIYILAVVLIALSSCQKITFDYANTPAGKDKPKYTVVFPNEVVEGATQNTVISPNLPVAK